MQSKGPAERWQVELKSNASIVQPAIIRIPHIHIPFRMSKQRTKPGFLDPVQQGGKIHRGIETGGLNKECVGILADRQHIAGLQPLLKERIHHMFSGKMEYHRPVPGLLKDGETCAQIGRSIWIVFHHMRRQPDFPHTLLGIPAKHSQCIIQGRNPVIDTWKNMAVPVGPATQEAFIQ